MLPCLILAFFVLPACSFRLVKQKGGSEIELDAGAVDELAVSGKKLTDGDRCNNPADCIARCEPYQGQAKYRCVDARFLAGYYCCAFCTRGSNCPRSEVELDAGAVDELAVSTSEALFFTFKKGALFCGNGQLTVAECQEAASQLGNDFRGEMNDRTYPIGCFEEDGSIYFNKHWKGEVRSNVAPVCKQGRINGQFVTGFRGTMDVLGETLTVAECQDAASVLVLTFKGETNRDDLPPGCSWLLHLSRVWFNEHPTGKANKDAARVFKLDAATLARRHSPDIEVPQGGLSKELWARIGAAYRR